MRIYYLPTKKFSVKIENKLQIAETKKINKRYIKRKLYNIILTGQEHIIYQKYDLSNSKILYCIVI